MKHRLLAESLNQVDHISSELCWCRPIRKRYGADIYIYHRLEETLNAPRAAQDSEQLSIRHGNQ